MLINRIEGTTRVLGKAQGYLGLPVRDYVIGTTPALDTSWTPTPDEIELLNAGNSIILTLLCVTPPPMKITVASHKDQPVARDRVQELLEANNALLERARTAETILALVREEAAKDNSPLHRSNGLALDRIRTALGL